MSGNWPAGSGNATRGNGPLERAGIAPRANLDHRLFCRISMNWRGRPLISHEVIVQTVAETTHPDGARRPCRAGRHPISYRHKELRPGDASTHRER